MGACPNFYKAVVPIERYVSFYSRIGIQANFGIAFVQGLGFRK